MKSRIRAIASLGVAGLVALGACGGSSSVHSNGFPTRPESAAQGREVVWVEDAPSLVRASDLVVRATVAKTDVGQTYGSEGDSFTTRFVSLQVEDVLWSREGDHASAGSTIQLEEEGYDADKTGYVMNGVPWSAVGDQGFYFLVADPDGGDYRLVNSQGRVMYTAERKGPTGERPQEHGPWKGKAASLTTQDAIQAAVSQAASQARREGAVR